jgi:hypothetical protein
MGFLSTGLPGKLMAFEQWCVGYAPITIDRFLADPSAAEFRWLKPPRSTEILADPFGLEQGGQLTLFAERLVHGRSKGQIVRLDTTADVPLPELAMAREFHMSYPFIVEDGGRHYLVPEQAESKSLCFYPIEGDTVGAAVAEIEGLDAVDPTFLFHEGLWWLFCTRRRSDPNAALYLYFSERLFGPYRPHAANPVILDPAQARPGGRIIRQGNTLLRPVQDCSVSYGAALSLCRIELLSPTAYVERPVQRLEPGDLQGGFAQGLHTLDHTKNFVIVDTKRFAFAPFAGPIKIADRLAGRRW